jgi:hypothetical protein
MNKKSGIYYVLSYVTSEDRYAVLGTYDSEEDSADLRLKPYRNHQTIFKRVIASESHDDLFLAHIDDVTKEDGVFLAFRDFLGGEDWLNLKDTNIPEVELDHENEAATLYFPYMLNRSVDKKIVYWIRRDGCYARAGEGSNWKPSKYPDEVSKSLFPQAEGILGGLLDAIIGEGTVKSIKIYKKGKNEQTEQ